MAGCENTSTSSGILASFPWGGSSKMHGEGWGALWGACCFDWLALGDSEGPWGDGVGEPGACWGMGTPIAAGVSSSRRSEGGTCLSTPALTLWGGGGMVVAAALAILVGAWWVVATAMECEASTDVEVCTIEVAAIVVLEVAVEVLTVW